jgi:hypothetical protein
MRRAAVTAAGRPKLRLVGGTEAFQGEPAPRQTDVWARLRVMVAVALLLSLGLWALIGYALTRLISNWP